LELLDKMEKPVALSDEDFARAKADKQAMAHSGLALVYYHQSKTAQMVAELAQAIALDPAPDPLNYFLLGDGNARLKKYADAAAAYERCGQMPWAWQEKCKAKMSVAKNLAATQPAPPAPPAPAQPPAAPTAPPTPARDPMKPPNPPRN
jgi:tetratricopeptide (TPR) repeat protein